VETALETQRSARSSPEEQLQRRRNILQEQQEAERTQLEREAALLLKKNELDRAERLYAKRYISDAELNRIETEYQTLQQTRRRSNTVGNG
jgi:multidrug resistance efflux pump